MRVLWFSIRPSLYGNNIVGGTWVVSLQRIVMKYCPDIQLAIAFEHEDEVFKVVKDGVTYYPMNKRHGYVWDRIYRYFPEKADEVLLEQMRAVVKDYKPDVIQCFGSEWPWGLITPYVDCPVVIHMQGFLNIYDLSAQMAQSCLLTAWNRNPKERLKDHFSRFREEKRNAMERRIMATNHHFLIRTEWDEAIVRYYGAKDAKAYYCPEAIRPEIYDASERWAWHPRQTMQIVSVSSGSVLKGNEIIFRTAAILKSFGFDFHWKVVGDIHCIKTYLKALKINPKEVGVELLGFVDGDEIVHLLATSDAYVHAAIIDNSPNSLCEAQLVGCPVVTSYVGGIPQLVTEGETGLFFPYNEPHTLAFKLMRIHENRELAERLSVNGFRMAKERHAPEKVAGILHGIYQKIFFR